MIKLVKYDLKSILPDFFGFYLALLGLSALFPLFIELSSIDFLIVLYGLALFGTFVGMVVLSYVAIFNLFNKKLFSSQGYLTLTLPIDTRRLLGSKIITSLILTSLTGVVFTLSGVLAGLGRDHGPSTLSLCHGHLRPCRASPLSHDPHHSQLRTL